MSDVDRFRDRVRLQAFEVLAAYRCQLLGTEPPTLNGDLRQQLDRLAAIVDEFTMTEKERKALAMAAYRSATWVNPGGGQ